MCCCPTCLLLLAGENITDFLIEILLLLLVTNNAGIIISMIFYCYSIANFDSIYCLSLRTEEKIKALVTHVPY